VTPMALKLGEAGSAFTKFDGGRCNGTADEAPLKGYNEDSCCDGRRRRRLVTNSSFDERRRPLRNADDSMLDFLDSAPDPDVDFRSRCRRDVTSDGLPVERGAVSCAKSTSCADVRSARRRSLAAVRRRSDDDDEERRGRLKGGGRTRGGGARRTSTCCSGSESSLHQRRARPGVKSVYYNGLLASMIDLTAASDRTPVDDRLSCRATSGPRRSLRASRQSPVALSDRADRFTSSVHHSSGDLLLRSVQ